MAFCLKTRLGCLDTLIAVLGLINVCLASSLFPDKVVDDWKDKTQTCRGCSLNNSMVFDSQT